MKNANKQFSTVYIVSTTDRLCKGSKTIELILKFTMDDSITSTTVS